MTDDELQKLVDQAGQLQQQKKLDDCIALWTKCISLQDDPHGQSVFYYYRGFAYGTKGEHDRAIEDFDKALSLNPKDANAYLNRGVAYANKGKYGQAIEDYNESLRLEPNNADAYLNRGIAYVNKGEYSPAFRDFLLADKKDKNLKSQHPGVYLATQIKDIFGDGEKGAESFEPFSVLYTAIANIKQRVLFPQPEKGKEVAHYTSLHTLKKLTDKEECFRLYNVDYVNDPEEGRAFLDIIKQENPEKDVESLFYSNNKETPGPSPAYIGSFVVVDKVKDKKKDKDKLFLWRTYGKHDVEEAAGACLIFKHDGVHFASHPSSKIGARSRQQPPKPALYRIAYLSDCKKENEKENNLPNALDRLVTSLEAVVSFYNGSQNNQKDALAKLVRELLDDIRFLFKADHYKEGLNPIKVRNAT